jgi:hypothetical protein
MITTMTNDQRTFNQKANAIRDILDHDVHQDDLPALQEKLLRLTAMIGLSAELKARAKSDLKTAELIAYAAHKHEKLPPTVFKIVIEGESAEAYGKLELADRLNAGLSHCMESLRTVISLKKEEMKNSLLP